MRYKSLLYLRAGAIFTRSFARGSGLQRGEREQEARLSRAEGEKGGSFGWLRGVNANLKIPPSPLPGFLAQTTLPRSLTASVSRR